MGVLGLTTFIDNHPELLTDHKLHDCKVVIDGNNLYFFLYTYYHVRCAYGGDYDTFAVHVRSFLKTLYKCNITPVVVFDGAYELNNRKLQTCIKRSSARIAAVKDITKGLLKSQVVPLTAYNVFVAVLADMQVERVMADFEADAQIAGIAKTWCCPVMSNDSDFFIFDLPGGLILYDYVNLAMKQSEKIDATGNKMTIRYIDVQVYYQSKLFDKYNFLNKDILPVFATVIGNDYVSPERLHKFYSNIPACRKNASKSQQRIAQVLNWLKGLAHDTNILSTVVALFDENDRKTLENLVQQSVDMYLTFDSRLLHYLDRPQDDENFNLARPHHNKEIPLWFMRKIRCCEMSCLFLDVLVSQTLFLPVQVEDLQLGPSHDSAVRLRQLAYSILLQDLAASTGVEAVTEYTRKKQGVAKVGVAIVQTTPSGVVLPSLQFIPQMSKEDRLNLLCDCASVSPELFSQLPEIVPTYGHLAITALIHCIHYANPVLMDYYIKSIIVCLIKLAVLDVVNAGESAVPLEDLRFASNKLKKFATYPSGANPHYNVRAGHAVAQFQACCFALINLNQLLLCPLPHLDMAFVLNGSLVHNLIEDMKHRSAPDLFIGTLLGEKSALYSCYQQLCAITSSSAQQSTRIEIPTRTISEKVKKKRMQKKLLKKLKATLSQEACDTGETASSEEFEWESVSVEINCEISNKFALLKTAI